MYFAGQGIQRPKDMVGKRLQYPGAPSALGLAIAKTMIEADGGDFTEDAITSVDNGFFHTDALVADKADLATLVFYNFEVIEARKRGYDAQFFALKDWGIPDFCQLILIATPELLQQRQQELKTFLSVLRRGIDFIHQKSRGSPGHLRQAHRGLFGRCHRAGHLRRHGTLLYPRPIYEC